MNRCSIIVHEHDLVSIIRFKMVQGEKTKMYSRNGSIGVTSGGHAGTFKFFSPVNPAGHIVAGVAPHFR